MKLLVRAIFMFTPEAEVKDLPVAAGLFNSQHKEGTKPGPGQVSGHSKGSIIMEEHPYAADNVDLELLFSLGFSETEVSQLVYMKSHVTEEVEYREMVEESRRLNFIRWLIEHGRLSEE